MSKKQIKELNRREQMFYYTYWMLKRYDEIISVTGEIKAIRDTAPEDHTNLQPIEERREELIKNFKGLKLLVEEIINYTEQYYEQNNLEKWWL